MHVVIYEPIFWGGHNFVYVSHLVAGLSDLPVRVTVVTGQGAEASDAYRLHLRQTLEGRAQLAPVVKSAVRGEDWGRHYFEALVDAVDALQPDHVFIPTSDIISAYAGSRRLRRQLRWNPTAEIECNVLSSFYRRGIPLGSRLHRLKTSAYVSHAPWTSIFTNDPFVDVGGLWRWIHGSVPRILPDPVSVFPVTSKSVARARFGLPTDALIVGCAGHFASHGNKNPVALMQGFLRSELPPDALVALVGPMSDEIRAFAGGLSGDERRRVVVIDRLLSAEEIQSAVLSFDLLCAPYVNHHQASAIVMLAAVLGRPVLAPDVGWFQAMIPLCSLGWVAPLGTADQIGDALTHYAPHAKDFKPSRGSELLAAFSRRENFSGLFTRRLRNRLGEAEAQDLVTWEAVLQEVSGT